jgi:hypothetical protein
MNQVRAKLIIRFKRVLPTLVLTPALVPLASLRPELSQPLAAARRRFLVLLLPFRPPRPPRSLRELHLLLPHLLPLHLLLLLLQALLLRPPERLLPGKLHFCLFAFILLTDSTPVSATSAAASAAPSGAAMGGAFAGIPAIAVGILGGLAVLL